MSPVWRSRRSFWRRWQQTLVLCAVVVGSNFVAVAWVCDRIPTTADIAARVSDRAPPPVAQAHAAEAEPAISTAFVKGFAKAPVDKVDKILSEQLKAAARSRGLPDEALLPAPALREAALRTRAAESSEGRALLVEYARIFQALGQPLPDVSGGAAVPPTEGMVKASPSR